MPSYEYECGECGAVFDARRSIEFRDDPVACPMCEFGGGVRVQFPLDGPSVDVKGSFKMGAVLKSGETVPGHFGREARRGRYHKP